MSMSVFIKFKNPHISAPDGQPRARAERARAGTPTSTTTHTPRETAPVEAQAALPGPRRTEPAPDSTTHNHAARARPGCDPALSIPPNSARGRRPTPRLDSPTRAMRDAGPALAMGGVPNPTAAGTALPLPSAISPSAPQTATAAPAAAPLRWPRLPAPPAVAPPHPPRTRHGCPVPGRTTPPV